MKDAGTHQGAVFTVAGSSGKTSDGPFDHPAMYTSQERLGSVILDVDNLRIDVTFLDDSGIVRDEFTLFTGSPRAPLTRQATSTTPLPSRQGSLELRRGSMPWKSQGSGLGC